ncbi:uncharacterized protein FRV6_16391 [Fusarium oxysporum]|uniref:Uncharacterized protein n=1 Tax=Fusarium oxysporum TaxID=5507 RepID=A0A2H3TUF6_FUSOX|nr:uncharacterized protein FRV6_16391 [Fusarium oxysporum]
MTPRTCDNARETEDPKAHRHAENAGRHKHWHIEEEPQSGCSIEFRVPPERLALENKNAFAKDDRSYSAPVGDLTGPNVTTQSASK